MNNFFKLNKLILQIFFLYTVLLTCSGFSLEKHKRGDSVSNYFSGIISQQNYKYKESYNFFKKLENLEDNHSKYSRSFLESLLNNYKINEAFNYSKKLKIKKINFFQSDLVIVSKFIKNNDFKKANNILASTNKDNYTSLEGLLSQIIFSWVQIENSNFVVLNYGSDNSVLIKFQSDEELSINAQTVIDQLLADNYLGTVEKSETIFPQIGEELRDQGGIAILVAMLVILVYIIFRFQIKFGYGAIAALFHDVLIILGIFSVFNLTFDLSVLAALLAVVGYSLNDSIVVSDRIRENFLDENKKGSSEVLLNDSLNQVFARTIITSFTTLLVLIALLVAGGEALKNFSLALAAGVLVGSYSSIFIVVRVLMMTDLSKKDMEKPKNEPEESYSLD